MLSCRCDENMGTPEMVVLVVSLYTHLAQGSFNKSTHIHLKGRGVAYPLPRLNSFGCLGKARSNQQESAWKERIAVGRSCPCCKVLLEIARGVTGR